MKQKYLILKDNDKKALIIREFAELDKEILSPLCEETYDAKVIHSAIKAGKETLIRVLRTKNMYPPGIYANQIADAVLSIFAAKEQESLALHLIDEWDLIKRYGVGKRGSKIEKETEKGNSLDAAEEWSGVFFCNIGKEGVKGLDAV